MTFAKQILLEVHENFTTDDLIPRLSFITFRDLSELSAAQSQSADTSYEQHEINSSSFTISDKSTAAGESGVVGVNEGLQVVPIIDILTHDSSRTTLQIEMGKILSNELRYPYNFANHGRYDKSFTFHTYCLLPTFLSVSSRIRSLSTNFHNNNHK